MSMTEIRNLQGENTVNFTPKYRLKNVPQTKLQYQCLIFEYCKECKVGFLLLKHVNREGCMFPVLKSHFQSNSYHF